jgi:two-component system chemotaxis response regulator CheY
MSQKLLFIDDSRPDAMLLHLALIEAGQAMDIVQAEDGDRARAFLQAIPDDGPSPYRLIVIDVNLPRVDGFALLRGMRTRRIFDAVPIIMMTASLNPQHRALAESSKPTAFLAKPDHYQGMVDIARKLLHYAGLTSS